LYNTGNLLFIYALALVIFGILIVASFISLKFKAYRIRYTSNVLYIIMHLTFFKIILCATQQIKYITFDGILPIISSALALGFILIEALFSYFYIRFYQIDVSTNFENPEFNDIYSTMLNRYTNDGLGKYANIVILFRYIIAIPFLLLLSSAPFFQSMGLFIINLLCTLYFAAIRPAKTLNRVICDIVREILTLFVSLIYVMASFEDQVQHDFEYTVLTGMFAALGVESLSVCMAIVESIALYIKTRKESTQLKQVHASENETSPEKNSSPTKLTSADKVESFENNDRKGSIEYYNDGKKEVNSDSLKSDADGMMNSTTRSFNTNASPVRPVIMEEIQSPGSKRNLMPQLVLINVKSPTSTLSKQINP